MSDAQIMDDVLDDAGRAGGTRGLYAEAGEWRFDYLTGPAAGTPDPASAQVLKILQPAPTGQITRSGKQSPRIDR